MKFSIHDPKSLVLIRGTVGGIVVAVSFILAPLMFKYLFFASFMIVLVSPALLGTFFNRPELRAAYILAFPLIILLGSAAGAYLSKSAMDILLWLGIYYIFFGGPLYLLALHFSKKSKSRLRPFLGPKEFCLSLSLIVGVSIFLVSKVPVYLNNP